MLRTIDSDQLRPGMYVYKLLGAWVHHPFWKTSFLVDADDVGKIHDSRIEQLVIDTARGLDVEAAAPAAVEEPARRRPRLQPPNPRSLRLSNAPHAPLTLRPRWASRPKWCARAASSKTAAAWWKK